MIKKRKKTRKILIIEPNPITQMLLEYLCAKNPFFRGEKKISIVPDLKEAKARIKRTCRLGHIFPDVIVVSERMSPKQRDELYNFYAIEQKMAITLLTIDTSKKIAFQ